MEEFFKGLFTYSHYFNQKIAEVILANNAKMPTRSLELFSHMVNAHHIWNCRIMGANPQVKVWSMHPLEELMAMDNENYKISLDILTETELNTSISYSNSKGNQFANSVQDILFHVNNHSTHHRGQIVMLMRQQDIEPPVTDYIFYKR
ncbi:DinB family protein [Chondrinema litorale]|uniref:DinB family protein n=1 Tax=Chondrinema litorale TaxID=2994555 RepID=UPI0025439720|nr:DinB family protein [Chondrinema litorale]UZR95208.1 damage-inducible protein DinB [Chondrinema litorale]